MKKHTPFFTLGFASLITALVLAAGLPGCTPQPTAELVPTNLPTEIPTAVPATQTPTASPPVLEIVGFTETISFTLEEVLALPVTEGYAGIKSSTGKITPPVLFKGVALKDLADLAGGIDETTGINLVAEDGYSISFSFKQVMEGDFIAYDPATGNELKNPVDLTAILAYEREGEPLDPKQDGTLRLVIVSSELNQVTDGHWSVKWVNKVETRALVLDWTISAQGDLDKIYDRATIESCGSPQCHSAVWTDDKAQDWVGVPLWYFVGGVDDEIEHEGPAFNEALADIGYTVDIVASDGYTVTFDSERIRRNNDILLAFKVNENPLPDQYFPLRLVGSGLESNEMVGLVAEIIVAIPEMPDSPVAVTAEDATFSITGLVDEPLYFTEVTLRALDVRQLTAEHPKKGAQDYEGVAWSELLSMAAIQDGATNLVLIAGDGFTAEVPLADLQACADCLLAFTDTVDEFFSVMPGFDSNTWVKNLVNVEVK